MELKKLQELDVEIEQIVYSDQQILHSFFQEFKMTIEALEKDFTRKELISHIPKIRQVASDSPLLNRSQKWPKGYQGDFETIEHIISQENRADPHTFAHALEGFFLNSSICQQHINKVKHQSELISDTLTRNSYSRILSIGCGTSEDVRMNIHKIIGSNAEITLVDFDRDSLHHSLAALEKVKEHIKIFQGNIYKIIKKIHGKFDLVMIGGVFDYLSDKMIINILSSLKEKMNEEGIIYFTNIKQHNPFRIYMEYLADWILIERSHLEIQNLLIESRWNNFPATIQTDTTCLTYLVEIKHCVYNPVFSNFSAFI